jgi:hypothetical protein
VPTAEDRPLDGKAHQLFAYQPKKARINILHYLDPLAQFDFGDTRKFDVLNGRAFNITVKVKDSERSFL